MRSAPLEDERASARDSAALESLYAQHSRAIHRFLCDMIGDRAEAADATQETFARAFRRIDGLRAADRPVAWLFGVARHVSLEVRRARRRARRIIAEQPDGPFPDGVDENEADTACSPRAPRSPEDELLGREAVRIIDGALSLLSDDRRAILLLRLDHGLAYEDIAELMGWSLPKVKVEIHRARQILRAELGKYERGPR
jgi:RNA polymerase sigma-70 factor (ECF subfamily)